MKTMLEVKRPNGQIENIDVSNKFPIGLNDKLFSGIKAATANAGRGEVVRWYTVDDRDKAAKAYDAVLAAQGLADRDGNAAYVIRARMAADKALAEWRAAYPQAAARMDADDKAKAEAKEAEIKSSARYNAINEMRD